MSTFPPMTQQEHDKALLDLAHAVAYATRNFSNIAVQNLSVKWLSDWEALQGKEYLEDADIDWTEKRIHVIIQLLVSCHRKERNSLLLALAHNIDAYASVVSTCPEGYFSKDIDVRVANVLDGII
jgi:hypothetical protein